MSLKQTIQTDFISAMKAKDQDKKSALSGLKAKITEAEKLNKNIELTDDGVIKVIVSSIKQRKQSVDEFTKGNRVDLVEKEQAEINILETYLPSQMTELEIEAEIVKLLPEVPPYGPTMKLVGQTMGMFNKKFQGRADGNVVRKIIERIVG